MAQSLTSIDLVLAQLQISSLPPQDNDFLVGLIPSSSAWVIARLGQEVLTRTVIETWDGDGSTRRNLRQFPVSAVTSVVADGVTIPARTVVGGEGWVLNRDGIDLVGYEFSDGIANVVITYTAGLATCPTDLQQATTEHVALRYRDRQHTGMGSRSIAGDSVAFNDAGTLAFIEGVIDSSPLKVWVVS